MKSICHVLVLLALVAGCRRGPPPSVPQPLPLDLTRSTIYEAGNWKYDFGLTKDPENQIVVDYGDMEEVVLLGVVETATGAERPLVNDVFPVVRRYDGFRDFNEILKIQDVGREGFVVKFDCGVRVKVKFFYVSSG